MCYLHIDKGLYVRQLEIQEKMNQLDISLLHSQVEYSLITFDFLRKYKMYNCETKASVWPNS